MGDAVAIVTQSALNLPKFALIGLKMDRQNKPRIQIKTREREGRRGEGERGRGEGEGVVTWAMRSNRPIVKSRFRTDKYKEPPRNKGQI